MKIMSLVIVIFQSFCAHSTPILITPSDAQVFVGSSFIVSEPNPTFDFSASALSNISDNDLNTGVTFLSNPDDYLQFTGTSSPRIIGFAKIFSFDLSAFSNVTSLSFSWIGFLEKKNPSILDTLRIGPSSYSPAVRFTTNGDGSIVSGGATFSVSSSGWLNLSQILIGDIANIWVQTDFGSGSSDEPLNLTTLEAYASVNGSLLKTPTPFSILDTITIQKDSSGNPQKPSPPKPEQPPTSVSEPSNIVLFLLALAGFVFAARLTRFQGC